MEFLRFYSSRVQGSCSGFREGILSLLKSKGVRAERLLDAGGGDGSFTLSIAKVVGARDIWIVDLSDPALDRAKRRDINAVKVDLNVGYLPFSSESFDMISAIDLIEHLFDPDHFLKEANRVLKKKGYLALTTPNLAFWANRLLLLLGFQPLMSEASTKFAAGYLFVPDGFQPAGHIRMFTLKAIEDLLKASGFRIIAKVGLCGKVRNSFIRVLDSLLSRKASLAMGLGILAEKISL